MMTSLTSIDVLAGVITTLDDNWIVCKRCQVHRHGMLNETCRPCNEEVMIKRGTAERIIRSQLKNGYPHPFYLVETEGVLMKGGSLSSKQDLPVDEAYRKTKLQGFAEQKYAIQEPGVQRKQPNVVKKVYQLYSIV